MSNFVEEGDVTAAVVDILRNHAPRLNAAFPNTFISSGREGQGRDTHAIIVARRGGVPPNRIKRFMDHARVDIDTYGPTRDDCIDLARYAKAAIAEQAEEYTGHGLTVTSVTTEIGPTEQPDPQTQAPRVFQSLGITVASLPEEME